MSFATQLCNRAEERVGCTAIKTSQSECQTAQRVANFSGDGKEDDEDEVSECALGIYEVQRSACTCTLHRENKKKKKKMGFGTVAASLILLLAAPFQSGAQYFNPEFVSPAPRGGNRELHLAGYSAKYPSVQVNGSTGR